MVLVQVWILNNIQLSGYINPYLYIMFLLVLPFEISFWILIPAGFLLGITIDMFMHTPGLHAAATVFAAFVRPGVLSLIAPGDGYEAASVHIFPQWASDGICGMLLLWYCSITWYFFTWKSSG